MKKSVLKRERSASMPIIPVLTAIAVIIITAIFGLLSAGCAPKTVQLDMNNLPNTPHCEFAKESCAEAEEFQKQYNKMGKEEREDAKAVLNAFVQKCGDAQELCVNTMDR